MGKRGPRPKPSEAKKRAGNPGKRKLNDREPTPAAVDLDPEPPDWINVEGKAEWRRLVPHLRQAGLLAQVDLLALAVHCQTVGQYIQCQADIDEQGMTMTIATEYSSYRQVAPEVSTALKLAEKIRHFAHEFGLTPSARVGLVVETAKPADKLTAFRQGKPAKKPG